MKYQSSLNVRYTPQSPSVSNTNQYITTMLHFIYVQYIALLMCDVTNASKQLYRNRDAHLDKARGNSGNPKEEIILDKERPIIAFLYIMC